LKTIGVPPSRHAIPEAHVRFARATYRTLADEVERLETAGMGIVVYWPADVNGREAQVSVSAFRCDSCMAVHHEFLIVDPESGERFTLDDGDPLASES